MGSWPLCVTVIVLIQTRFNNHDLRLRQTKIAWRTAQQKACPTINVSSEIGGNKSEPGVLCHQLTRAPSSCTTPTAPLGTLVLEPFQPEWCAGVYPGRKAHFSSLGSHFPFWQQWRNESVSGFGLKLGGVTLISCRALQHRVHLKKIARVSYSGKSSSNGSGWRDPFAMVRSQ